MTTDQKVLLCAYAIAEWTTALEHVEAVGRATGKQHTLVLGRIESERMKFMRLWWAANHGPTWHNSNIEQCVAEARAWVTDHLDQLDEVLSEKEEKETTA